MMGFSETTPIQDKARTVILKGHGVVAVSQTGTGKTVAFFLPNLQMLAKQEYPDIHWLNLDPILELIMQVDQQLEALSYFIGTSAIPVYGGRGGIEMEQEKKALKRGGDAVVVALGCLIALLKWVTPKSII